jgi:glycerol-3-phosphate acyltransferase PlsY
MVFIISLFACYIIGSIPTSYLVAKHLRGIDIRQHGSGNVGATNTARVVGKGWGLLVLAIDILKGLVCVTLAARFFYRFGVPVDMDIYPLMLGAMAIIGHIWSIFLGFNGGKGIATSSGVFIGVAPGVFLIALFIWIAVFVWKRYVSLASIVSAVAIPVMLSAEGYRAPFVAIASLLSIITVLKHFANIKRLVRGEEHRFELRKHAD